MAGIKTWLPEIKTYHQGVTADEMDMYRVVTFRPATNAVWWASAGTAGTSSATAMVMINRLADTPRNVRFALIGSASGMAGSLDVVGRDQFGGSITETLGFASADNGGTVVGTKVFLQVDSGTLRYGTAVGNGTPNIGFVTGTNCLLGLPDRLGGTTDVVHLGHAIGTGAVSYGGGTIAAFVDKPMSAIRPAATLDGTTTITCWYKPTYNAEAVATNAGGTQAV